MILPSQITLVQRKARRKFNKGKPIDSYPYLSGDSYFFSCEYYFHEGQLLNTPSIRNRTKKSKSLFVKTSALEEFIRFLSLNLDQKFLDFSLVIHNGDDLFPPEVFEFLTHNFAKVFAVNVNSLNENLIPIPIGLENQNYFLNGVPTDFDRIIKRGIIPSERREILVLQSFNVMTNRGEREACANIAKKIDCEILEASTQGKYRKCLSESRFVLSPPGNGWDCHRTWEALYLGAIPIVKRAYWPFSNYKLPVLVIDEWSDLCEMNLANLSFKQNFTWAQDFWKNFYDK